MIKIIKLITTEEIIADVEDGPHAITLKHPAQLGMSEKGLILIPYSPLTEEDLVIDKLHILHMGKPRSEVMNVFQMKFGGIVQAQPSDINHINTKKEKLFI
jgi:hypothetical protein